MAEYIEREEAHRMIVGLTRYFCTSPISAKDVNYDLDKIPAADVAPVRHGRWTWDTEDIYVCSVCSVKNHVKEVMGNPDYSFCPNCGAKMDLEDLS